MNLLARAKSSTRLFSYFSSSEKYLFYRHSITALQRCNFYATRTATAQKTTKLTKPRIQKSSESSSVVSQRIKKQVEVPTAVWPRPGEMPYQAKVANFVNFIGYVKIPVRFESDSDGKHFTTILISLGNGDEKHPLLIPVVFEGDLAHIVACHVKEGDCVFVAGRLSADPLRLVPMENLGKSHVVAENLNFVERLEKGLSNKKMEGTYKLDKGSSMESSFTPLLNAEPLPESPTLELGNVGFSPEEGSDRSGETVSRKNGADQIGDLWTDLVKNPLQWYDYRKHKTNGLVKETHPDFKLKGTGEALWIRTAPKWLLTELGKLECDVQNLKPKQVQGGVNPGAKNPIGKLEDSWKNLLENPNKWWDNRTNKKNPKAPDFKHKDTGEALWLNNSPVWALSKVPPLRASQSTTKEDVS